MTRDKLLHPSPESHHSRVCLTLDGPIAPKARPRFGGNAYLPSKYRDWKNDAIMDFRSQYHGEPLEGVAVAVELSGRHSRRADADNIVGAILDALVQAQVLRNDSLVVVSALSVALHYSKAPPTTQITITQAA